MKKIAAIGCLTASLIASLGGPARADLILDGIARTGTDTRAVRFRFFCSSNDGPNITGALGAALDIPRHDQLRTLFDFDRFEGPDAAAGTLSRLQSNGIRTRTNTLFAASGSIREGAPTHVFSLEVSASRRDPAALGRLATVLRPLMDGPGQFLWTQGSGRQGAPVIAASVDLPQARADQLRAAIGACVTPR